MKKVSDGWHNIQGHSVWVENGKIMRGERDGKTVYPYRATYKYATDGIFRKVAVASWNKCCGISIDTFKHGVKRGVITMR